MLICCELHMHVQQQLGAIILWFVVVTHPEFRAMTSSSRVHKMAAAGQEFCEAFPLPVEEVEQE